MNKINFFSLLVASFAACTEADDIAPQIVASDAALKQGALIRVSDPSEVCMVNDQYMAQPQIAVAVGERTYYGCCEMCKGRLVNDPNARTARDPVSGASVDKAIAVIVRTSSGKVLYFENDATFARYASAAR